MHLTIQTNYLYEHITSFLASAVIFSHDFQYAHKVLFGRIALVCLLFYAKVTLVWS